MALSTTVGVGDKIIIGEAEVYFVKKSGSKINIKIVADKSIKITIAKKETEILTLKAKKE